MSDALPLSSADIREALRKRFATANLSDSLHRPRTLVAYFGTGQEDVVDVDGVGQFRILPVRSELELRERLPPLEDQEPCVFLVPWPGQLPIDVQGRFAADGKIMRIGR